MAQHNWPERGNTVPFVTREWRRAGSKYSTNFINTNNKQQPGNKIALLYNSAHKKGSMIDHEHVSSHWLTSKVHVLKNIGNPRSSIYQ